MIYRSLAFGLTHPKLHRRRKRSKVEPPCLTSKERIGYPELELVANMECKKVDEMLKKAISQIDQAVEKNSETNDQKKSLSWLSNPSLSFDTILAQHVTEELAEARRTAISVNDFVISTYFDGPKLKRKAAEALGYYELSDSSTKTSKQDGLECSENLPWLAGPDLQEQEMKDVILSLSEDTAIIQHTACAVRSIARRLARRRIR